MQLRFRILLTFIAIHIACFPIRPLYAHGKQVLFITEEAPPNIYTHNGKLTGYNIDLIKFIWKKMSLPEQKVKVQPWARSIKNFDNNTPTCLFPVILTNQRKENYRSVTTPFSFKVALFTLKKNAHLFKSQSQTKKARICVTSAASILSTLRNQGYTEDNFEYGSCFANTVKKFHKERAPLLVGSIPSVMHNYRQCGGKPSDLQIVKVVGTLSNGFIFNDAVPQEFIDRFQRAMDEFEYSDETKFIYEKAKQYYNP